MWPTSRHRPRWCRTDFSRVVPVRRNARPWERQDPVPHGYTFVTRVGRNSSNRLDGVQPAKNGTPSGNTLSCVNHLLLPMSSTRLLPLLLLILERLPITTSRHRPCPRPGTRRHHHCRRRPRRPRRGLMVSRLVERECWGHPRVRSASPICTTTKRPTLSVGRSGDLRRRRHPPLHPIVVVVNAALLSQTIRNSMLSSVVDL